MARGIKAFRTDSMMLSEPFWKPMENRTICREAVVLGFIALTTCDGSSESAKHAEPDERTVSGRDGRRLILLQHVGRDQSPGHDP